MFSTQHSALDAFDRAPDWINSEPLTAEALRGRVVLIDIWTFSCVNWLRTLPYVRAWADKYADRGLVVVGVHAPEFGFEHKLDNVRRASADLDVAYPVVIDNDFAIWRSLHNNYWPAIYLVDREGGIQYRHFGEEAYEETERAIQEQLDADDALVEVEADGLFKAADWNTLQSPETYVGFGRGERRRDARPEDLRLNEWALGGRWTVSDESAVLDAPGGSVAYCFEGRDLNLVMTPPSGGSSRFTVLVDGQPPGDDRGIDVDKAGKGVVDKPRMYQLVRQAGPVRQRTCEITFHDPDVAAYVFTFG